MVYTLNSADWKPTLIGSIADEKIGATNDRAKAEAVLPLALDGQKLTAVILFDGLAGGGARQYKFN